MYLYICQLVDNKVFLPLINILSAVGELSKYIMLVLWWAALTIKKDLDGSQLNQFFLGFFHFVFLSYLYFMFLSFIGSARSPLHQRHSDTLREQSDNTP